MIEIEALGWVISIDPSAVLAPGMFLALIVALLSGFPVAFCLGGVGVIFALLGMLCGEIEPQFVTALPQRILGIMANFTLLAIPAFVFMGSMLESSGIAERLLETMGQLLGRLRGAELVPLPESESCCGSAGVYSMLRPADSRAIFSGKLEALEQCGADVLVTANPGCQLQWESGLARAGSRVVVKHLAEVLRG